VRSLAADSQTRWASGGHYYEAAAEVRDAQSGALVGWGYSEGVGWDHHQIQDTVATALRTKTPPSELVVGLLSSRPPRTKPPPH
jgi:hypothetical protein